jgi:DNA-binding Lrp family transcriptional regulator
VILGYEITSIWKNVPKGQFNPTLMRTMLTAKIDPKEIPNVIEWILKSKYAPGIRSAYETYGDENFSFSMVTGKLWDLENFVEDLTKKFNFRKLDVGVMLGMRWRHHALGYEYVKPE